MTPIAYLDDEGWNCAVCHPTLYQGRLEDVMRHLVDVHGIKSWTVSNDGMVFGEEVPT